MPTISRAINRTNPWKNKLQNPVFDSIFQSWTPSIALKPPIHRNIRPKARIRPIKWPKEISIKAANAHTKEKTIKNKTNRIP